MPGPVPDAGRTSIDIRRGCRAGLACETPPAGKRSPSTSTRTAPASSTRWRSAVISARVERPQPRVGEKALRGRRMKADALDLRRQVELALLACARIARAEPPSWNESRRPGRPDAIDSRLLAPARRSERGSRPALPARPAIDWQFPESWARNRTVMLGEYAIIALAIDRDRATRADLCKVDRCRCADCLA